MAPTSRRSDLSAKPPPPGAGRRIADALEDGLDRLVERTLQSILAEIPAYGHREASVAADARRATAYVYSSFLDTLRTGRPPNEAVARSLGHVGADRAAQGISLGDLLQAFRITGRTAAAILRLVVEERDLDRDAALWVAEALVAWIDRISNLAARDYSLAQARLLHEAEEARRSFLLELLYGGLSGEHARVRAEDVGWDPSIDYWVAVAGRSDGEDSAPARDEFALEMDLAFVTSAHGDIVLMIPAAAPGEVQRGEQSAAAVALRLGMHLGLTVPRSGFAGVRRSYLEAAEALDIARALDLPALHHRDAVLDRILRNDPKLLGELVEQTITPLAEYDAARGTQLVVTLTLYFDAAESPSRTAESLHTHPQTIRYRLNRIAAITGLHLDTAEGRLHLMLGLRARALLPRGRGGLPHLQ